MSIPVGAWAPAAVLFAGLIAGIVGIVGHLIGRSNARLQARLAARTAEQGHRIGAANARLQTRLSANMKMAEMRQAWINALRDDMARFQSLGVTPAIDHLNEQEFYRLGTRIELFMNPADPDYPELHDCLYAFLEADTIGDKYAANPRYVAVCQRILKREWNVLRDEVRAVTTDADPASSRTSVAVS